MKLFDVKIPSSESVSLREIARQAGINPGQLSRIVNGKRRITPKTLLAIIYSLSLDHCETIALIQNSYKNNLLISTDAFFEDLQRSILLSREVKLSLPDIQNEIVSYLSELNSSLYRSNTRVK